MSLARNRMRRSKLGTFDRSPLGARVTSPIVAIVCGGPGTFARVTVQGIGTCPGCYHAVSFPPPTHISLIGHNSHGTFDVPYHSTNDGLHLYREPANENAEPAHPNRTAEVERTNSECEQSDADEWPTGISVWIDDATCEVAAAQVFAARTNRGSVFWSGRGQFPQLQAIANESCGTDDAPGAFLPITSTSGVLIGSGGTATVQLMEE